MKRMISIFLTAALLISLLSTTVFGETISEITLSFTAPSVGDSISKETLKSSLSFSSKPSEYAVQHIYTGITVPEIKTLNSPGLFSDFINSNEENIATGTYTSQLYIAVISISLDSITDETRVAFSENNGDKLFYQNSLYVYIAFTPSDATGSNNNTTDATTNITDANGRDSRDVYVTYQEGASSPTIYSVDIVWQSMEFTYTAASKGTWDPETHAYTDKQNASWSFENNKITVTNHSNAEVKAKFTYTPAANFRAVNGAFVDVHKNAIDNATLTLNSAVGYAREAAPSDDAFLSLSGELPSSLETQTICGTVTVTIN